MKAAIKSWAWRTPLGSTSDGVLQRLLAGERAACANPRFDAANYACTLAAAIPGDPAPSRHSRFLRRTGLFALEVAVEALAATGLRGDRVGLFFGYGGLRAHWSDLMPAFEHQTPESAELWDKGLSLLHPYWMLQHLSNNAHAIAAQELCVRGEGVTLAGANAGAQALSAAIRALAAGAVDAALVVGYDSLIEPETIVALGERGVLCPHSLTQWAAPYDVEAQGFVPGEAAAALVLQRPGEGGEALAYVQASVGADGEKTHASVDTLARLVAGIAQWGDAVDGAGMAQPSFDLAERFAVAQIVGNHAPLCSMMGAMGHMGAASSVVQVIALAQCLRRNILPPIAGLHRAADVALRALAVAENTALRSAIGLSCGTPGLAGVVRVELP